MFSKFHSRKGFTLIELMIVVVIIGILAALAIPRFMQATTKSKQSEAKGILKQIYVMERAYRQENGTYSDDLNLIGVEIAIDAIYAYTIVAAATTFTATATTIAANGLDDDATADV
ncbi:MAG: prepilin-type N-terminal cleavage/methylation domain-containing protein, partial [candidate division Zixibacteria bacterium]|nr:prepilin-type N-terminal cleavage/methylation domain-containing protein [candidate division Zixibacteria bacterium]